MLNALKSLAGGKSKTAEEQTAELERLIAAAREERSALGSMLTTLTARGAKLTPTAKALEQVVEKPRVRRASSTTSPRAWAHSTIAPKSSRTSTSAFQALKEAARQAELSTQKAIGPDGELQKHREAVQHLSSQALQTHAALDTLKKERAGIEELRGHLREAEQEVKQTLTQTGALRARWIRFARLRRR